MEAVSCPNSIQSVFTNPIILSNIFAHLDIHCVKSFRTVSIIWNTIGASVIGSRTIFRIGTFLNISKPPEDIQKINPAVIKRVTVGYPHFGWCNTFTLATSKWWRQIQEIHLIMTPNIWPAFVEILVADGLPSLVKLALTKSHYEQTIPNFGPVPLRNLKAFEFHQMKDAEMHNVNSNMQTIIYSAPNLNILKIHGDFFPDLGKCAKTLKTLEWFAVSSRGERNRSLEPLHSILIQVAPTLEHLSLGINHSNYYKTTDHLPTARFPAFPRLLSLQNLASDIFKIEESLDLKNFPRLVTLSQEVFGLTREHVRPDVRRDGPANSGVRHEGITKLKVGNISNLKMVSLEPRKFPSVKQLTLEILPHVGVDDEYLAKNEYLVKIIQVCGLWKHLTRLVILLGIHEMGLKDVVEALHSSLGVISGLTELKIDCRDDIAHAYEIGKQRTVFDDLTCDGGRLYEFISSCGALKRLTFQGIWWKSTSMVRILDFLAKRRLFLK